MFYIQELLYSVIDLGDLDPRDLILNRRMRDLLKTHPTLVFMRTHPKSDIPKCGFPNLLKFYTGDDCFRVACSHNQIDLVEAMLKKPDPTIYYPAVFHNMCNLGHLHIAKLLFAMPDVKSCISDTYPVMIASAGGHLELVEFLISSGYSIDLFCIVLAQKHNHDRVVDLLRSHM